MKQLFLTSSVHLVAKDISNKIKTKTGNLRTAYITTPIEKSHENDLSWHEDNKKSLKENGFDIFEYTITGKSLQQINHDLEDIDVLYVEGGSFIHMMNQVRAVSFDKFIDKFVEAGKPYIGTSTGSIICSPDMKALVSIEEYVEDGFDSTGLGLVNFLLMPHWGSSFFQDGYKKIPIEAYTTVVPMITINDFQYVYVNGKDMQIINTK